MPAPNDLSRSAIHPPDTYNVSYNMHIYTRIEASAVAYISVRALYIILRARSRSDPSRRLSHLRRIVRFARTDRELPHTGEKGAVAAYI